MSFFVKKILGYPLITYIKNKINQSSSYAQRNEDLVVKLLLGKVKRFIDIGANDGITGSNSFLFALQGAQGLCFEPVYEIFKRLSDLYLLNSKVICINEGISDEQKKYEIRVDGVISTIIETEDPVNSICLKEFIDKNARRDLIEVKPLPYFINKYPDFQNVDLVSIDVEGHELNVIKGLDFDKINIRCIIIESLGGKSTNYDKIELLLKKNDFAPILTNELNTIFMNRAYIDPQKIETVLTTFNEYRSLI
jgi:FkbM family methyltransferase